MRNKIFLSFILSIVVVLYSLTSFASNEVVGGVTGNVLNNTDNIVNNVGGAAESVMNGVTNVSGYVGNGIREGAEGVGNFVMKDMPDNSLRTTTTDEYNAVATNTTSANTFLGLNTMSWWWIIIGAICVLFIILIWHKMNNSSDSEE